MNKTKVNRWFLTTLLSVCSVLSSCGDKRELEILDAAQTKCSIQLTRDCKVIRYEEFHNPKDDSLVAVIRIPEQSLHQVTTSLRSSTVYHPEILPELAVFHYNNSHQPLWVKRSFGYSFIGKLCRAQLDTTTGLLDYKEYQRR